MSKVIVVTGASSGIGALSARALSRAGHTVYAGMRQTQGRNAPRVAELREFATANKVRLHSVELDVLDQDSVDAAIARIVAEQGRLDVVLHNAGHLVVGPTEAFSPEELAAVYNTNVLGAQRVNRAALPHLRAQGQGLLLWTSSSSVRGGTPPFLTGYFAAKAALDSLAVGYAAEVSRFGIETAIIVPGAFTNGTNHFPNAGHPADTDRVDAYEEKYGQLQREIPDRLGALIPPEADVALVAEAIVDVVDRPHGTRPFRTHIDPSDDGSEVVSAVADKIRGDFYRRIELTELLHPAH
ncbi:SDR family oxidoreductase [Crossiella cryophila]|uniref:NAD(P)-dependent dehydrogenase (Short-subunit alcohol dehydrogenase family) n=1 Tax=Crossiella cryophila TaxID=43355 RepID=A0A7W7FXI9_9PSEU|nr:SDR family oxidoreductase [Crossiella cryophila]MBB4681155.1 NAD(P)-dependent dehydrogenase (short-subunit alcohol dehydrogenase family) [Crossiella cryophila]